MDHTTISKCFFPSKLYHTYKTVISRVIFSATVGTEYVVVFGHKATSHEALTTLTTLEALFVPLPLIVRNVTGRHAVVFKVWRVGGC